MKTLITKLAIFASGDRVVFTEETRIVFMDEGLYPDKFNILVPAIVVGSPPKEITTYIATIKVGSGLNTDLRLLHEEEIPQDESHTPPTKEPLEATTRPKNPVEKDEIKVYEECPACNTKKYRDEEGEAVFDYIRIEDHAIVNFYNRKIMRRWNKLMRLIQAMLTASVWASYHPWYIKPITHRRFMRIPWDKAHKITPLMKRWEEVLYGHFILKCKFCRIEVLVDDPRDYVGIDFEEE